MRYYLDVLIIWEAVLQYFQIGSHPRTNAGTACEKEIRYAYFTIHILFSERLSCMGRQGKRAYFVKAVRDCVVEMRCKVWRIVIR